MKILFTLILFVAVGFIGWKATHRPVPKLANSVSSYLACATNPSGKKVVVSESRRHMWACDGTSQVADYPAVTGYSGYKETITPVGNYTISNKLIGIPLKGSDQLGSWNVFVKYWMPFLTNKYGDYGFHDATWRKADEFGNVSASSRKASHGCVEVPMAGMKWLYGWAPIGTRVSVVN